MSAEQPHDGTRVPLDQHRAAVQALVLAAYREELTGAAPGEPLLWEGDQA